MTRLSLVTLTLVACALAVASMLLMAGGSRAVQAPRLSFDMVTDGNGYDAASNAMTVGALDSCLTTGAPGDNAEHSHFAHVVIQDVEDLVAWQARLNYDGGRMRPATVNFSPFSDGGRGQNVSFVNLPIDPVTGVHRDIISAATIPPQAAGAQTALIGSTYASTQTAPVSPDTPPKAPPDDNSYSAPGGGVVASVNLQVLAGQAGQALLTMDMDDADPNAPGSKAVVFSTTGSRSLDINLAESALGDGFHGEGVTCVPPVTPPPAPTQEPGTSPGTSPGSSPASSPGATDGGSSPGGTQGSPGGTGPAGSPTATNGAGGGTDGNENGDGTSAWVFVVIAVGVVAALAAGGFAAWRYRARLPWLRR